jgi:4-hydroxybenzoate polyprenyltransferase
MAAFFFAFFDRSQSVTLVDGLTLAVPAMLLFCLTSSGIYLLNDLHDLQADRAHPAKRYRPLAAGRLSPRAAVRLAVVLLTIGLIGSVALKLAFGATVLAYVVLQTLYTTVLKRVALVDVFVIATGFVLRALAGAVVLAVTISPWLLLCAFLLALFLALCKRRHEKMFVDPGGGGESRASLLHYDARLLDLLLAITVSATIVCYAIYTLYPETVAKFGTARLGFTVPFVMFGLFRYLDLVYRHEKGDRPEKILLTDPPILITLALYGLTVALILLTPR